MKDWSRLPTYKFIQSFISGRTHDIYFMLQIISNAILLLCCSHCPALFIGSSSRGTYIDTTHHIGFSFWHLLIIWDQKMLQAYLYFPCPTFRTNHFSKDPRFLLLEDDTRYQVAGAIIAPVVFLSGSLC